MNRSYLLEENVYSDEHSVCYRKWTAFECSLSREHYVRQPTTHFGCCFSYLHRTLQSVVVVCTAFIRFQNVLFWFLSNSPICNSYTALCKPIFYANITHFFLHYNVASALISVYRNIYFHCVFLTLSRCFFHEWNSWKPETFVPQWKISFRECNWRWQITMKPKHIWELFFMLHREMLEMFTRILFFAVKTYGRILAELWKAVAVKYVLMFDNLNTKLSWNEENPFYACIIE